MAEENLTRFGYAAALCSSAGNMTRRHQGVQQGLGNLSGSEPSLLPLSRRAALKREPHGLPKKMTETSHNPILSGTFSRFQHFYEAVQHFRRFQNFFLPSTFLLPSTLLGPPSTFSTAKHFYLSTWANLPTKITRLRTSVLPTRLLYV